MKHDPFDATSSQANLAKVCNTFYSKLYAYLTLGVHIMECFAELLRRVPCKFSRVAQKVLEALLMEVELTSGVHALAKGKSPCPNRLTIDFFKAN